MPVEITTLANSEGVAETFTLIGRDRTQAEWFNTTDTERDVRLFIRTNTVKGTGNNPIRRSLISCVMVAPPYVGENGQTIRSETCTVNLTIAAPEKGFNPNLPLAAKQSAAAYVENLLSNATVIKLLRGEV